MKKMTKQVLAFAMVAAVAITSVVVTPSFSKSAKKPALSKKSATLNVGETVKIKVKNANKKAKVTWKTTDKKVAKIAKKVTKGKKAYAKVKAVAAGTAKIKAAYKAGKTKKNLTCKITVGASADVATDAALTVAATTQPPKATTAATKAPVKGTATPKPKATATPKRTAKPTATPKYTPPTVTAKPNLNVDLSSSNANIINEYDNAGVTFANGQVTIVFDNQWEAVSFYLPDNAQIFYSEYKSVTLEYESTGNALSYALYDKDNQLGEGKDSETGTEPGKHVVEEGREAVKTGTHTMTINATSDCKDGFITGIQIYNQASSGTTTITIKKITFNK